MPPQIPQTPYPTDPRIVIGAILSFLVVSAIALVVWLIYDKFYAPTKQRRARARRIEAARKEMRRREKHNLRRSKEREALQSHLDDILMETYERARNEL